MMNSRMSLVASIVCIITVVSYGENRKDIRIPDLPEYVTLKCDFHMHTVFSDGEVWPTVRVKEAWREGLDAIAITDHIEYQPHKNDIPSQHNRSYEIARQLAHDMDMILVKASEITRSTPPGHYNALFLTDSEALAKVQDDFQAIMEEAGRQKAFIFWNHHAWKGEDKGMWTDIQTQLVQKGCLHGMEVVNGGTYYHYALDWCSQKNLVMLGDSDIHAPSLEQDNNVDGHRPITLVFAKERSFESLREAVFAGRTAVWGDDMIYGRPRWLSALAAEIIQVGKPFHIKNNTWGIYVSNKSCIPIELTRDGEYGPKSISLSQDATTLAKFEVEGDPEDTTVSYKVDNFWVGDQKPVVIYKTITGFNRKHAVLAP